MAVRRKVDFLVLRRVTAVRRPRRSSQPPAVFGPRVVLADLVGTEPADLLRRVDISIGALANAIGYERGRVRRWLEGSAMPAEVAEQILLALSLDSAAAQAHALRQAEYDRLPPGIRAARSYLLRNQLDTGELAADIGVGRLLLELVLRDAVEVSAANRSRVEALLCARLAGEPPGELNAVVLDVRTNAGRDEHESRPGRPLGSLIAAEQVAGEPLAAAMARCGVSPSELARAAGVDVENVRRWCDGMQMSVAFVGPVRAALGLTGPGPETGPLLSPLGQLMERRRTQLGMSRPEFNTHLKMSKDLVSAYRRGRGRPTPDKIPLLAAGLGMPATELVAKVFPEASPARRERLARGLSLGALAEQLGVTPVAVRAVEVGTRRTDPQVVAVRQALGPAGAAPTG